MPAKRRGANVRRVPDVNGEKSCLFAGVFFISSKTGENNFPGSAGSNNCTSKHQSEGYLMNQSIWLHLFQKYAATDKRILPSADGEPWVSYEIVAELLTMEPESISKLVTKHKIPRHPVFTGLVKISSFGGWRNELSRLADLDRRVPKAGTALHPDRRRAMVFGSVRLRKLPVHRTGRSVHP